LPAIGSPAGLLVLTSEIVKGQCHKIFNFSRNCPFNATFLIVAGGQIANNGRITCPTMLPHNAPLQISSLFSIAVKNEKDALPPGYSLPLVILGAHLFTNKYVYTAGKGTPPWCPPLNNCCCLQATTEGMPCRPWAPP
jgi:hypothetical protein